MFPESWDTGWLKKHSLKILIIRFSSIGDIVLTSPVVRICSEQVENAEIHFLTKPIFEQLLIHNPHIKRVHILNQPLKNLAVQLRSENFDVVLDLHNNLRTRILSLFMRKRFQRFNKLNLRKWLYVKKWWWAMPEVHIVDRYLRTAHKLNVVNDGKGLDFFLPPKVELSLPSELPSTYTCYAIGGQHTTKKMPTNLVVDLCKKINHPVVLIGGQDDMPEATSIAKSCSNAINLCGELSIDQSAYVVKGATSMITHDTGMMHIASAMKKTVFSIWGNTTPELGMSPYLPRHDSEMFEVNNLGCRPCSKIGHEVCPNGHFKCMKNQDLSGIAGAVNRSFLRED